MHPREETTECLVGWHPVHEALIAGTRTIARLLVSAERRDSRIAEIVRLAKQTGVPIVRIPSHRLRQMTGPDLPHQGVVAEISPRSYLGVEELLSRLRPDSIFVVLDEIQDPRNLGAILRTAAAVGATGVFLPSRRSASLTPAAVRASAGGAESVPVARGENLGKVLTRLGEVGIRRIGLDPGANDLYTIIPGRGPVALVLGGEERGLRPSVRAGCDLLVRIPVPGPVGSLNVSVAAGIGLYEILRARSAGDPAPGGRLAGEMPESC